MNELFCNDIHWFCMTAARTHSRMAESRGVLLMADKGVYHLQKVGFTTPRGERVQVTHQQNTVGFLYGLLTSTKPGTCVPSLQAERAETRPQSGNCFLQRLHVSAYDWIMVRVCVWMCMHMYVDIFKRAHVFIHACVWVSMCASVQAAYAHMQLVLMHIRVCVCAHSCVHKIEVDTYNSYYTTKF